MKFEVVGANGHSPLEKSSITLGYDDPLADLDLQINLDDLFQPGSFNFVDNHSYIHTLYNDLSYQFDKSLLQMVEAMKREEGRRNKH